MKNKVKLKRYLVVIFIVSMVLLSLFLMMNVYEYDRYTSNFNKKIDAIVSNVKAEYPEVTDEEIIDAINKEANNEGAFFKEYGIDIEKEGVLIENDREYHNFLIVNSLFLLITICILLCIFLQYERTKNREINAITKYIEEINKKNYSLQIDENSEDELSILKNEIYKTTIMLKEAAENSLKDKKELKKSIEDISHQLKTPLTSILIILDNIIDDPDMDTDIREDFVRDIKREVTNINFLVQALLKLSKFDVNTMNFSRDKILVADIVNSAIKNVSTLCDLKNVDIEVSGNENSIVNCDFMWEIEAITNILKNCVEHSKQNGKIIIRYEQNNVYTSISIKDFGDGIDEKDLPHVFERFYKGKNSGNDSIGIGLALAKMIIREDGGNISVESSKCGTEFKIKYFSM